MANVKSKSNADTKSDAPRRKASVSKRNLSPTRVYPVNGEGDVVEVMKQYLQQRAEEDAFAGTYSSGNSTSVQPIEPPYNINALTRLVDENFMLRQCIDAMVTNVHGHGYRWEFTGEDKEKVKEPGVLKEQQTLQQLLDCPNGETSWREFSDAVGTDLETTGNSFVEIGRDNKQRVVMVSHVVSTSMRLTGLDKDYTEVEVEVMRDGKVTKQKIRKRFRRFMQLAGSKRIYFKEFGDPRRIDPKTGLENENLTDEESATEIFHFRRYNPRSPYGVPRWLSQLPSVLGSRQAELTNLDFFNENGIPAMAVLVSGGALAQDTINHIEDRLSGVRGRRSRNRVVVIEVEGDPQSASPEGQIPAPRVDMKPLHDAKQQDGLFLAYKKDCGHSIRSSFRLPPLFVGLSEDMNYATAKTSFEVAESQVFATERSRFDEFVNMAVLASWKPKFWSYRSLPARITDSDAVVSALDKFNTIGGMTPNTAIGLANEYFGLDIAEIEDEWGNWPFDIVKALAARGQLKGIDAIVDKASQLPEETEDENAGNTDDDENPAGGSAPQEGDDVGGNKNNAGDNDGTGSKKKADRSERIRRIIKNIDELTAA